MITDIKNSKNTVPTDINGEKIVGILYEKELQKTNQKEVRKEKVIKRKGVNYMKNGQVMIIHLIV